jgi:hypothetical protein
MFDDLDISNVTKWSIENVSDWMRHINFDEYTHEFKRQKINGQALIMLNEDDTRQLINRIGDRKNFYFHVRSLKFEYDKFNLTKQVSLNDESNTKVHLNKVILFLNKNNSICF